MRETLLSEAEGCELRKRACTTRLDELLRTLKVYRPAVVSTATARPMRRSWIVHADVETDRFVRLHLLCEFRGEEQCHEGCRSEGFGTALLD